MMLRTSIAIVSFMLVSGFGLAARAQSEIITRPFHDCCEDTIAVYTDARRTNEATCNRAEQVLDSSCDGVCCFGHAFFDPCPGIIGCPGDVCPIVPDRPDSECVDSDGDGLLDDWEVNGVDGLDLAAMGADPNHKDLFVELDFMGGAGVSQTTVEEVKRAFCAAPASAGGAVNPDGTSGIRVWIDTGDLEDGFGGRETPIPACSCGDGADNDGDGVSDAFDDDCLALDTRALEDGAGAGSCDDNTDNGGDGVSDENDPDCQVFDSSRTESPASPGSCLNGYDEDADGLFDIFDPDCLAGDNLGGGNMVAEANVSGLSSVFYDIKAANFSSDRARVFRYALAATFPDNDSGTSTGANNASSLNDTTQSWAANEWQGRVVQITSGTGSGQAARVSSNTATSLSVGLAEDEAAPGSCTDGSDNGGDGASDSSDSDCAGWSTIPDDTSRYQIGMIGGEGELGGNDFMVYGDSFGGVDPAAVMHELGHNLNLAHGGDEAHNCKPNYVSIMNYDHAYGIPQADPNGGQDLDADGSGDGYIIDFSPARYATPVGLARGPAPLAPLVETSLDEATVLASVDPSNRFLFNNQMNSKVQAPLHGDIDDDGTVDGTDWSGDGDANDGSGLSANIDTNGPAACRNTVIQSDPMSGWNDWASLSMSFGQFPDAADAPVNVAPGHDPTAEEWIALQVLVNTTDLSVHQSAAPDPVEVGADLTYSITLHNGVPNPAGALHTVNALPALASYVGDTGGCVLAGTDLICDSGQLYPTRSRPFEVVINTEGTCVDGLPTTLVNELQVDNAARFAGADSAPADNHSALSITPVDTTPPDISNLLVSPSSLWPPNHKFVTVTVSATVTDICDDSPVCAITNITSNEAVDAPGSGNTAPDFLITTPTTAQLRAERAGNGSGRIYTLTYTCTDASANSASAEVIVTVPHNR